MPADAIEADAALVCQSAVDSAAAHGRRVECHYPPSRRERRCQSRFITGYAYQLAATV